MRISDWSSDVCSSDLPHRLHRCAPFRAHLLSRRRARRAGALPAHLPRLGSGAAALAADRRRAAALSRLQRSPRLTSAPNMEERIDIVTKPTGFDDWAGLFALLRESFAFMDGRIDPPSSLHRFDAAKLAVKARDEEPVLAFENSELPGCLYAAPRKDSFYHARRAGRHGRKGAGPD